MGNNSASIVNNNGVCSCKDPAPQFRTHAPGGTWFSGIKSTTVNQPRHHFGPSVLLDKGE